MKQLCTLELSANTIRGLAPLSDIVATSHVHVWLVAIRVDSADMEHFIITENSIGQVLLEGDSRSLREENTLAIGKMMWSNNVWLFFKDQRQKNN